MLWGAMVGSIDDVNLLGEHKDTKKITESLDIFRLKIRNPHKEPLPSSAHQHLFRFLDEV